MQEVVPGFECREHLGHRRGDIGGRGQGSAGRAQPALRGAKLAGRAAAADLATQELLVQLAHEAERQGRLPEAFDPVAQSRDAAAYLAQVVARHARGSGADLVEQKVGEAHLGALDAR